MRSNNGSSNNWMEPAAMAGGMIAGSLDYKNPANAASPYYDQIQSQLKKYYQPYINSGSHAMNTLQSQYGNLLNNPGQMENQMGQSFHSSPGFQYSVNQATNAANNAAAAGGMLGSPAEQEQLASNVTGMANQDYYNYLGNAMNLYNQGLNGMQGINNMGFNASSGYADQLANSLAAQGNMAYMGQQNQNQSNQGLGAGIGMLSSFIPSSWTSWL